MRLSRDFLVALKLAKVPQYEVALQAGVRPTTLSSLVNGSMRVREHDERILAVGRVLGLRKEQCFEGPAETGSA